MQGGKVNIYCLANDNSV